VVDLKILQLYVSWRLEGSTSESYPLIRGGAAAMGTCMLVVAILGAVQATWHTSGAAASIVFIYLESMSYQFSWGALSWVYLGEIFPNRNSCFQTSHATVQNPLYSFSDHMYLPTTTVRVLLHSGSIDPTPYLLCNYTSLGRVGALVALACISLRSLDSSVSVFANFQAGILRANSSSSSVKERPLVSGTRKKMSIQTHVAVATNSRTMNGSGAGKAR
jgi:hypothetical protein